MADSFKPDTPSTDSFKPDSFMPDGPKEQSAAIKAPEGSALGRFASGAWDTTVGGIGSAAKMLYHLTQSNPGYIPTPEAMQDLTNVVQSHVDQAKKAKESWQQGHQVEAVGHGLAAALPLVGPAAAHAGERIGGSAPEFDKYGSVIKAGQSPDVAGGLGEAAGLIAASSPKNIVKPIATGAARLAGKIPVPARLTPEGMYQSALRPSLAKKNLPGIAGKVQTGLKEEIPVDRSGLQKTDTAIDDLNTEVTSDISRKSEELGPDINPLDVTKPVNRMRPTFQNQVNPSADVGAINKSKAEFLAKHTTEAPYTKIEPHYGGDPEVPTPTGFIPVGEGVTKTKQPLTLNEAQAEKVGTYRQLRKKFGELGSADVESQKALARGLKDEIAKRVPEIAAKNAREGGLIELQSELERMVAREGNKNILGLVPAVMAHNPYGFLATIMLDNPAIKSRIAILLNKSRGTVTAGGVGDAAAAAGPLSIIGNAAQEQSDDVRKYSKGGIIRRPTLLVDAKTRKQTGLMGESGAEAIVPLPPKLATPGGRSERHLINSMRFRLNEQIKRGTRPPKLATPRVKF